MNIEIPESVLEAAAQAISRRHLSNNGIPFPISACRDDARAALQAALAEMLEPVGFTTPMQVTAAEEGVGGFFKFDASERFRVQLFRIRGPQ